MLSSALRNWVLTFGASGANALCGVATGVLAARLLQPEGRGALAEILLWSGLIAGVTLFSLPHGLALSTARSSDGRGHASLLRTALVLALLLSLVGIALGWPALAFLIDGDERLSVARTYLVLFLPVHFLALTLLGLDQGQQRFMRFNAIRLLPPVTYLAALLALWALGLAQVETVIWGSWAGTALTALVRLALAGRDLGMPTASSSAEARMLLRESGLIHLTALIGMLAEQVDRIIVVSLFPDAAVGQYVVGFTVASAAFALVSTAFYTTVLPEVARCTTREQGARLAVRRLAQTLILSLALLVVMVPLVPFALPLLFGDAYRPAIPISLLLLPVQAALTFNSVAIVALRGLGDWRAGPAAQALMLAVFLGLSGVLGASEILLVPLALLLGQLAGAVYLLWRIRRVHAAGLATWRRTFVEIWRSIMGSLARIARPGRRA